jgi:hypothetical protein
MINWNEYGRKRSWRNFNVLFQHFPGGTEENTEIAARIVGIPAEIRISLFLNKVKRYRLRIRAKTTGTKKQRIRK